MKHQIFKILTDRNPDGSVTYSQEDMEIIAEEYQDEQNFIKDYIGESYNILLDEIKKRIAGIAEFAYNDEDQAVHLQAASGSIWEEKYFVRISISLWGETLNQNPVCKCGEKIGAWICDQSTDSHRLVFTQDVDKEFVFKVISLF